MGSEMCIRDRLGNLAFALNDPDFESYPIAAFATPGAIALIAGTILSKGVDADEIEQRIRDREAFASVGLGWLVIVLIGTLPYWLGGVFHGPFSDASISEVAHGFVYSLFESMAGFTTTGATVIDASSPLFATPTPWIALLDCTHRFSCTGPPPNGWGGWGSSCWVC